mmetsp:Transcript_50446/g.121435  ORF Transcript_50446/g.121435 Transcript_50446/m.121435 type:complete len:217 (+) Transcript_50446:354-1004(+)
MLRIVGEVGRVEHARLAAQRALVPLDPLHQVALTEVPHLERVLRAVRARQNHVVNKVEGLAGHERAEDAPHGVPRANVPHLHGVVPPSAQQRVRVTRVELQREHPVRVAGRDVAHAAAHARDQALRRLVVQAHRLVLAGGRKHGTVSAVVDAVQLVLLVLDRVQALPGGDVPVLRGAVSVHGQKDILGLAGGCRRAEAQRRHGQPLATDPPDIQRV